MHTSLKVMMAANRLLPVTQAAPGKRGGQWTLETGPDFLFLLIAIRFYAGRKWRGILYLEPPRML